MTTRTASRPYELPHPPDPSGLPDAADLYARPAPVPVAEPERASPGPTEPEERRRPRLELSLPHIVGGALAAATAAALGSSLGVVGTVTGAVLASVIASLAGAVYTTSLRRTGDRVAAALRSTTGRSGAGRAEPVSRPGPRTAVRGPRRGVSARRVAVGAVAIFALAVAGVTATELLTGRSLSGDPGSTTVRDTVRGTTAGAGGTTRSPQPPSVNPSRPPEQPRPSATVDPEGSGSPASQTPGATDPGRDTDPTDPSTDPSTDPAEPTDPTDPAPSTDPTPSGPSSGTDGTGIGTGGTGSDAGTTGLSGTAGEPVSG